METNQLEVLAHIVLPSEILDNVSVVGVKRTSTDFVTTRDRDTREEILVATVTGTKSEDVMQVLEQLDGKAREAMEEVPLTCPIPCAGLSPYPSPKAERVTDSLHISGTRP